MKKTLIALGLSVLLVGCGNVSENSQTEGFETPVPSAEEIQSSGNPFAEGETSFVLMPESSEFYWKAEKVTGKGHEGLIFIQNGTLKKDKNDTLSGEFTIDMNEIIVLDLKGASAEKLVSHLKNDDFFSVDKFPTSTFTITKSERKTKDTFSITGDLTIKGITNPLTFDIKFLTVEGILIGLADISIDRTLWDIRYGSGKFFENLGDNMIKDTFETKITLSFVDESFLAE